MPANSNETHLSFCQPLSENLLADFNAIPEFCPCESTDQILDFDAEFCNANGANRVFSRKSHKADREKLRREKINDQFAELASALDPDRPKNDKASILIESVQVIKELRVELKQLQDEHALLMDESRELTEEKNELKEEKAALKSEADQLQDQFQQHLRIISSWMMMDPTVIMRTASFPYSMAVPQAAPLPSSNFQQSFASNQAQRPIVAPSPYVPLATIGAFPLHPGLHTYATFGNSHADGSSPYLQFPNYGPPLNGHCHVERPYIQHSSQLHPMPPYLAQMQPHQGCQAPVSSSGPGVEICKRCASVASSAAVKDQDKSSPASSQNLDDERGGKYASSPSPVDNAFVEHIESCRSAVGCGSDTLPNDMNNELLSFSSSTSEAPYGSNVQAADVKLEDKTTVEQGTIGLVHEITSEQGILLARVDKPKADSRNDIQSGNME